MALACLHASLPDSGNSDPTFASAKRKRDGNPQLNGAKRPKTVGPFVMDDDDESDEDSFAYSDSNPNTGSQNTANDSHVSTADTSPFVSPPSSYKDSPCEGSHRRAPEKAEVVIVTTCSGASLRIRYRRRTSNTSYERIIAARSVTAPGRADRSYYGIDMHKLLDEAAIDTTAEPKPRAAPIQPSIEGPADQTRKNSSMMWTEKYRAKQFKDLIGDERTHRSVLRWLRGWDPIVFPSLARQKSKKTKEGDTEERPHRKVLLLTGPPGLGKTTLAHVCAKQAGYEVLEINASDERSRDVVKGRIRDAVGTENVRGMTVEIGGKKVRKSGKPVCVVVDEVDGVVSGSSGGEGGFMKALVDLLLLDQKNSDKQTSSGFSSTKKTKKGDKFRLLRPLILICNDVYHPSLRPLRTSFLAEIIHVRQVSLEQVVARVRGVFQKEGIQCDGDGVRRLCEASWGLNTGRERNVFTRGVSQGDIRGIMVAAEWIGHQLLSSGQEQSARLTKRWMEQRISDGSLGSGSSNGLGRGGTKEIVERVFLDGAGFPYTHGSMSARDPHSDCNGAKPVGVADLRKRYAIDRLREMIDASAEYDRCVTDCFLTYPTQNYQDDTFFSKPNAAYDWLHFHDSISSRVYSHQDWELTPYLSQSVVAFHQLFAATNPSKLGKHDLETEEGEEEDHPFSGPRADFAAFEAWKQNRSIITEFRATLSAPLLRTFRSLDTITTELVPNLLRMLTPDIKPVVVGGGYGSVATVRKEGERKLVKAAVGVMNGVGIKFDKVRVEMETGSHGGFVFRMEPPLDTLCSFSKIKGTSAALSVSSGPVRYAIRQVLEHEYRKELLRQQAEQRQQRLGGGVSASSSSLSLRSSLTAGMGPSAGASTSRINGPKRDFFGRLIANPASTADNTEPKSKDGNESSDGKPVAGKGEGKETKAWVSFHEGFSNAVRKGITMKELLSGL